MAHVLIIGASRGIGLEAVNRALACGHQVRAFARSVDRIRRADPNLEKFKGDALHQGDVARALDGIDVVIQALGVAPGPNMILGPVRLFSKSTSILVPDMQEAGVKRLICVTGFGAGDSHASLGCLRGTAMRLFLGRAYDDKSVQEELIRESNLDWTIARPVILTNGPHSGRCRVLVNQREWRNGLVSRADVADFLVGQIEDEAFIGKTPVLAY